MRDFLSYLKTNSSESGFKTELEIEFFEKFRLIFNDSLFEPQQIFKTVFEIGKGRGERKLFYDAIVRNLNLFNSAFAQKVKSGFGIADIVFVTPEYRGIAIAGGIATMVADFCQTLVRMGVPVTVIIPYYHKNK